MTKLQKLMSSIIAVLIIAIAIRIWPVGRISGSNLEYLSIGPKGYIASSEIDIAQAQISHFIGTVNNGFRLYKVYSIKNQEDCVYLSRRDIARIYERIS